MGTARRIAQWFRESIILYPTAGLGVGVAVAAVALLVDRVVMSAFGQVLPVSASNAQVFMAGVVSGILTATAILFWIRGMLVQLSSGQFSSRVLRWYLEDRFQMLSMAYFLGGFAYVTTVLFAIPAKEGATAPPVATFLAILVAFGTLLVIVGAIAQSVRATRPSVVISRIAGRTADVARERYPRSAPDASSTAGGVTAPRAVEDAVTVDASGAGWVQKVDGDVLLAALPAGGTAWVTTRTGYFAIEGESMVRVHAPGLGADDMDALRERVRAAVTIGETRGLELDVESGSTELVDIALSNLSDAGDTTSAYEVIWHLVGVMREVLLRDITPMVREDDQGRRVVFTRALSHADHVRLAFDQLRYHGVQYPAIAISLLQAFGLLTRQMEAAGFPERSKSVREQGELVLAAVRDQHLLERDRARILAVARQEGFG